MGVITIYAITTHTKQLFTPAVSTQPFIFYPGKWRAQAVLKSQDSLKRGMGICCGQQSMASIYSVIIIEYWTFSHVEENLTWRANNLPVRQASQHECLACNKDPPMKWGVIQRKCRQAGPCRVEHLNNICSGDQRLNSNCSPSEFIQAAYSR